MARLRNNLRQARKVGNEQYDTGYQYRAPDRTVIKLGPWEGLLPTGRRDLPPNVLTKLQDAVLMEGVVKPRWLRTSETVANKIVVGLFDAVVHTGFDGHYQVIFYYDNTVTPKKLYMELRSATGVTLVDTTLTEANEALAKAQSIPGFTYHHSTVYFNTNSSKIWSYNIATSTLAELTNSTAGSDFIFFQDNNLVQIVQTGAVQDIKWTVDGSFNDWSGYGSGAEVVASDVGRINGIAKMDEGTLLAGPKNAMLMQSTQSVPSFRFSTLDNFPGLTIQHARAIKGVHGKVYFVRDDRIVVYTLSGSKLVGGGDVILDVEPDTTSAGLPYYNAVFSDPVLYHSEHLNLLAISSSYNDRTYFLDLDTERWSGDLPYFFLFMADTPAINVPVGTSTYGYPGFLGIVREPLGVSHNRVWLSLRATTFSSPVIKTGVVRFGQALYVSHLDIHYTGDVASNVSPILQVGYVQENGSIITRTYSNGIKQGNKVRYWADEIAHGLEAETKPSTAYGFYDTGLVNDEGNLMSPGSNIVDGWKADINGSGNLAAAAIATVYTIGIMNSYGNFTAVEADLDDWPKHLGIQEMNVYIRSLQSAPDSGRS